MRPSATALHRVAACSSGREGGGPPSQHMGRSEAVTTLQHLRVALPWQSRGGGGTKCRHEQALPSAPRCAGPPGPYLHDRVQAQAGPVVDQHVHNVGPPRLDRRHERCVALRDGTARTARAQQALKSVCVCGCAGPRSQSGGCPAQCLPASCAPARLSHANTHLDIPLVGVRPHKEQGQDGVAVAPGRGQHEGLQGTSRGKGKKAPRAQGGQRGARDGAARDGAASNPARALVPPQGGAPAPPQPRPQPRTVWPLWSAVSTLMPWRSM